MKAMIATLLLAASLPAFAQRSARAPKASATCMLETEVGHFYLTLPGRSVGIPGHLDWGSTSPYIADKGHFDVECRWMYPDMAFQDGDGVTELVYDCWAKRQPSKRTRFEREGAELMIHISLVTPHDSDKTKKVMSLFDVKDGVQNQLLGSAECLD